MESLLRAKRKVHRRSVFMGFGIFFTLSVFAFRFDGTGSYWLWTDFPLGAVLCGSLALACWFAYGRTWTPLRGISFRA